MRRCLTPSLASVAPWRRRRPSEAGLLLLVQLQDYCFSSNWIVMSTLGGSPQTPAPEDRVPSGKWWAWRNGSVGARRDCARAQGVQGATAGGARTPSATSAPRARGRSRDKRKSGAEAHSLHDPWVVARNESGPGSAPATAVGPRWYRLPRPMRPDHPPPGTMGTGGRSGTHRNLPDPPAGSRNRTGIPVFGNIEESTGMLAESPGDMCR